MKHVVGAIEAGGTKFNCAVVTEQREVLAETRIATTTPEQTLREARAFFESSSRALSALGISCFGPIDLDVSSPTYGYITETPKSGWRNTDVIGAFKQMDIPVAFDTDVNGAAFGEHKFGAAQDLHTFAYYTIGTGIGGGGMFAGQLLHGLTHPEMGHVFLAQRNDDRSFGGICPYHAGCLEGLASGPALEKRWGIAGENLPEDHPAWDLEAHYIALALVNTICTISPQRIILGGGVMSQDVLFPLVRQKVLSLLNGYIHHPALVEEINSFIVPPALGNRSAIFGAAAMALTSTDCDKRFL